MPLLFFSGEDDKFIKNLSSGDNSKIRMIRWTEASKFLADDWLGGIINNAGEPRNVQAFTRKEYTDSVRAAYGYEISYC